MWYLSVTQMNSWLSGLNYWAETLMRTLFFGKKDIVCRGVETPFCGLTRKISFEIKPQNSLSDQSSKLSWVLFEANWGVISESFKNTYITMQRVVFFFYRWLKGESYAHLNMWSAGSTEELRGWLSDASEWASYVGIPLRHDVDGRDPLPPAVCPSREGMGLWLSSLYL